MAYVITQNCCKDGSCVPVCPVDCIRPRDSSAELTEMLYIDPATCIDCGACMEECPVDAVHFEDDLPAELELFREINARYFEDHPLQADAEAEPPAVDHAPVEPGSLRVAIVGAGPAGCYAATELARVSGIEVDIFDRLPTPFGLIRAGVAPDHQRTKSVVRVFRSTFTGTGVDCHLNVEVGRQLSHAHLLAHHHAVIYATGASQSRDLGVPGGRLPGHHAAADLIGWYNGHPDHADDEFDLSSERAVIIGNGNVALDVARILLMSTAELATSDIADHALEALSQSKIREVVILGRRTPADSAFSVGEFLALGHLPGIEVIVDSDESDAGQHQDFQTRLKLELARQYAARKPTPGSKRIIFRYMATPVEIVGGYRAEGLRVAYPGGDSELIEARLILRSIGHIGTAIEGLPFDSDKGVVPNEGGRVVDDGRIVPGVYVTGWIKRGSRGVIGTNRTCAEETVTRLWHDFDNGSLARDVKDRAALLRLLTERGAARIDWHGWRAIDSAERKRGEKTARPRVKYVDIAQMLSAAGAITARSWEGELP